MDEIMHNVAAGMPGWQFAEPPRGFGWAPNRHFRAELVKGDRRKRVVIRESWSPAGFQIERYLYLSVLGDLPVKTPRL
ncbi:MAG TPA: hypothetical protein HPP83_05985 [Candidatus Hydrogenedentes bacterium]|nr:hypothetical protein [Candidatus Hydrogenedentota bacterium]